MHPMSLTNEELLRTPQVRNDLTELERVALDRLQAALDEIDQLTRTLSEVQPELDLG